MFTCRLRPALAVATGWLLLGCADHVAYRGTLITPSGSHVAEPPGQPANPAKVRAELSATKDPFLKCHLWDGSVVVLQDFRVEGENVTGDGLKYDSTRALVERSHFTLAIRDVALFETNRPESMSSARVPVMATVTATSAALTALCVAVPKACFGSCPTIYAPGENGLLLQAEGFSSSIARVLEATDVDALSRVSPTWESPTLVVTNEAPETHAIRSLNLLAAQKPEHGEVFRSVDRYFETTGLVAPTHCVSEMGDCLAAISSDDDQEYKSRTNGEDLTAKEHLTLEFSKKPTGSLGLVITARNSLLNSYLYYQALAYMGNNAGLYLALLERGRLGALTGSRKIGDLLGGIDVSVQGNDGMWRPAGQYFEVGPLAKETELIRLPPSTSDPLRVRLVMTRGNMRVERVAIVQVGNEVTPERLLPDQVQRQGRPDPDALDRLRDPERYLVTYAGDAYSVSYPRPKCSRCSWFVESRGYYYEWMRDVWLPEEDPIKLGRLLLFPEQALRDLAPAYYRVEPEIDRLFWLSRRLPTGSRIP